MDERLTDQQHEVLREIGRNLLLYQYIERQLKLLLTRTQVYGFTSTFWEQYTKHLTGVQRQTMGHLVRALLEQVYVKEGKQEHTYIDAETCTEAWISINFSIDCDQGYIERKQHLLSSLVADRNTLAHHFLSEHDISSIEGCHIAKHALSRQREKALHELDELEQLVRVLNEMIADIVTFLHSAEGKKILASPDAYEQEQAAS